MQPKKLIIIDNEFPNLATGFRIAEFSYYLKEIDHSEVHSTSPLFDLHKSEYAHLYPDLIHKIKPFDYNNSFDCDLAYIVFLYNADALLPPIEQNKIPFIFTLYPDGKYFINDQESDRKLSRVCNSSYLRKVIVTQKIDYDYLINNKFTEPEKIEFIYGIPTQTDYWEKNIVPKQYYQSNKKTFDICFVAYKYMEKGLDKGYDIFIDTAQKLAPVSENIRFHVVGGFDENDINVEEIKDRIFFYGRRYQNFFPEFYSQMDILLTPDQPSKWHPGKYVFLSASVVQTALNGVAVFCLDENNLNTEFINGTDLVIIPNNVDEIVKTILWYFNNLDALYQLSLNGMKKFSAIFGLENQMKKRLKILKAFL